MLDITTSLEMRNAIKKQAIRRLENEYESVSKAFISRQCDGIFRKVADILEPDLFWTDVEVFGFDDAKVRQTWLGWELLTESEYIDV